MITTLKGTAFLLLMLMATADYTPLINTFWNAS